MVKQYKVLDTCDFVHLVCIKRTDPEEVNPYRLYIVYSGRNEQYGYYTEKRKQVAKYADMASVICMIKDLYINGMEHKPVSEVISWCERYYNLFLPVGQTKSEPVYGGINR